MRCTLCSAVFFFKQKTAYEMRISDWSSDVCSSDLKQPKDSDGEAIQNEVYAVGKEHGYENLRDWFKALYEILLGQEEGPRIGSFMALYGLAESLADRKSVV